MKKIFTFILVLCLALMSVACVENRAEVSKTPANESLTASFGSESSDLKITSSDTNSADTNEGTLSGDGSGQGTGSGSGNSSGQGTSSGNGNGSGVTSNTSSETSSTESKPQPKPTDIKGKKYHFYKVADSRTCYSITLAFDKNENKLMFDAAIGDDITDDEDMLKECISFCFELNNRYYYVGRGDGAEYPISSYESGKVTVSLQEFEGDAGSISYTVDGNYLTITGVVEDCEYEILSKYLENGDKLQLVD